MRPSESTSSLAARETVRAIQHEAKWLEGGRDCGFLGRRPNGHAVRMPRCAVIAGKCIYALVDGCQLALVELERSGAAR